MLQAKIYVRLFVGVATGTLGGALVERCDWQQKPSLRRATARHTVLDNIIFGFCRDLRNNNVSVWIYTIELGWLVTNVFGLDFLFIKNQSTENLKEFSKTTLLLTKYCNAKIKARCKNKTLHCVACDTKKRRT